MLAVNPSAGRGRGAAAAMAVQPILEQPATAGAGVAVVPVTAGSAEELRARVGRELAAGADALIVVGGDGMANLGVNAVAGTGVPLGIIAAGTGNDIARTLGLPVGDWPAAARAALHALAAGPRRIDAASCTGAWGQRWFAGVLGCGFDAVVNERANSWRWPRGRARYNAAILRELPVFRPRDYLLRLDGEPWEASGMLVAIANGPAYGGGMLVCPDASFDDGLLDVLVVHPLSRLEFLRVFPQVYQGRHVEHPRVEIRRARTVQVSSPGIVAYGDGERFGPLPIDCAARPLALRLLVPAATQPAVGGVPGG